MGHPPRLIDAHAHFDDACFDEDREAALQRAHMAGVGAQIIPGVKADWWPRIRRLCREYPQLHAGYGLHPMYLADHRLEHLDLLAEWIDSERPIAIGECGLDFYIENPQPEQQRHFFEAQLDLARDSGLPVIIHARRAVEEVINVLRRYPGVVGMLHSYSGSEQQAERLIGMGFYLSFGGPITYDRAKRLRHLVSRLPMDAILLESDAPDQPNSRHRGERNEPAFLPEVLATLSRLREESPETIAAQASANTRRLFKI